MPLRTFIIEDHPVIRANLIATLTELADIEVVGCLESETAAQAWLQQHPHDWDLGIVDLFLRDGTGLGVVAACQQRSSHQKVVLLSNFAISEVRQRCLQLGADAVFDKSHEVDSLLDYCRMMLRAQITR